MRKRECKFLARSFMIIFLLCRISSAKSNQKSIDNHMTLPHPIENTLQDHVRLKQPISKDASLINNEEQEFVESENRKKSNTKESREFTEYELVIPFRIHRETGRSVSNGRHFLKRRKGKKKRFLKRNKRDITTKRTNSDSFGDFLQRYQTAGSNSGFDEKRKFVYDLTATRRDAQKIKTMIKERDDFLPQNVANYSVSAFGENFQLHLAPYNNFLAAHYSVRYLGNDNGTNTPPSEPRHCFYTGYVNHRRDDKAVLSLCRGMFGAFRSGNHDYIIEPETSGSKPTYNSNDEEGAKLHRLSRRSAQQTSSSESSICGFSDDASARKMKNLDFFSPGKFLETFERIQETPKARPAKSSRTKRSLKRNHISEPKPPLFEKKNASKFKKSRRKRSFSIPRNIEVMVTADNDLVRRHSDIEHYVLTLMSIVHHIFLDPSIGNPINIVLVELIVIGDSQIQEGPEVVKHAHTCLRNFCQWQFEQNSPDDSHPTHHDTAVLITGKDICRSASSCDTLGLAELGTICNLRRSCSISEDNGLSTSFTIAHEMGHLLSAPHDNSDRCSDIRGQRREMNVMSPTLDNNVHPWSWSNCSKKFITQFLDNDDGDCLLDEPPRRILSLPSEDPGEVFDANKQCQFIYGPGSRHCSFMFQNTCSRLWCVSKNVKNGCRTPHLPWADGTSCGNGMWCQKGRCIPINRHRLPLDGSWGPWGRFGQCSRTCGGGIQNSQRHCNNPSPVNSGRYCKGERKRFRSCNTQKCSPNSNFRLEQCASYNNWSRFRARRIQGIPYDARWVPKYDGMMRGDRCKLTCQIWSEDHRPTSWYVLQTRVIDGTPCDPNSSDVCVEGKCMEAGCDHVIGSKQTEDSCGVCGGDGSSCAQVRGSYTGDSKLGYNNVTQIRAGATGVVITQRSHTGERDDNNYLVLRDSSGNYILNGNRSVMKSKQALKKRSDDESGKYLYNCDYTGTDVAVEVINCSKALRTDIAVEVLCGGSLEPPHISFEYKIPVEKSRIRRWRPYGNWTSCSRDCNGKMEKKIHCLTEENKIVPEGECSHLSKPNSIIKMCNTECVYKWIAKPGKCSSRCGSGTTYQHYHCWKVRNNVLRNGPSKFSSGFKVELVGDSLCARPKPHPVSTCKGECLPTRWQYSSWSKCSTTCGAGIQTRKSVCRDSNNEEIDPKLCKEDPGILSRNCKFHPCPVWVTSEFSSCSSTCGPGRQIRRVWCASSDKTRPDQECLLSDKPHSEMKCLIHNCPTWKYGNWGKCSTTCGEGISSRPHRCVDHKEQVVDPSYCDVLTLHDTRACRNSRPCGGRSWSPQGSDGSPFVVMRRIARLGSFQPTEINDYQDSHSSQTDISLNPKLSTTPITTPYNHLPPSEDNNIYSPDVSIINFRQISSHWRTGSWTQCSSSCGTGIRLRYVSCRHLITRREVDEASCGGESEKPPSQEKCFAGPCYGKWRTGSWSKCSASCGIGIRTRYVACYHDNRYYDDSDDDVERCNNLEKPGRQEPCFASLSCAPYRRLENTTNFLTPTSATHANTSSTQMPTHNGDSPNVSNGSSSSAIKKQRERWRSGRWSRCSVSCGKGVQTRIVTCHVTGSGSCDPRSEPSQVRNCTRRKCVSWHKGNWSKCSTPCGGGIRTRTVQCKNPEGKALEERECASKRKPNATRTCNLKECHERYHWWRGEWSLCSLTCGRGTKSRLVHCSNKQQEKVSDEKCATLPRKKPRTVRHCTAQRRCPKWKAKNWTECSSSCGPGFQSRRVHCKYKRKVVVDRLCDRTMRPNDTKLCNVIQCPNLYWDLGAWGQCSASCGEGVQVRQVSCRNARNKETVRSAMCLSSRPSPANVSKCKADPCASFWRSGPWNECSKTCDSGLQRRFVECVYIDLSNYTEMGSVACDVRRKPHDVRDCNRGSCQSKYFWRVGTWSECSSSCGKGSSARKVVCSNRLTLQTLPDVVCLAIPSLRPDHVRQCNGPPCIPETCLQLQEQQTEVGDGEYLLHMRGSKIKIYCHGMNRSAPQEYVTLTKPDENFSEVYGMRLIDPDSCPGNGSRIRHCVCQHDHPDEGFTIFRKVRIDVKSMRLIGNDFTFTQTKFGNPVSYGEAGDCYSRMDCPQGVFRINLEGTGLAVSSKTQWESHGTHSYRRIHKNQKRVTIEGRCGGYCSRCRPHPHTGLIVGLDIR